MTPVSSPTDEPTIRDPREWVRPIDAERLLCVSAPTVRRLIAEGRISSRKVGNAHTKVLASDVYKLMQESTRMARHA